MSDVEKEIISRASSFEKKDVTPMDLLRLAKGILISLMILFLIAVGCRIFTGDLVIFESCKVILPPIAGWVIGFYFGKAG